MAESETQKQKKQVRNTLWCVPRTISTAMVRAMHNKSGCLSMLEPLARSYYLSEERVSKRYIGKMPDIPGFKYNEMMNEFYNAEHAEYSVIFAKEMAHYVTQAVDKGLYKMEDLIAKNNIHTFLIRKPEKALKSMYLMYASKRVDGWDYWSEDEAGFKDIYRIYNYIKENIDPNPLVIDADDLLANPEKFMHMYCNHLGIEFEDSMINWNPKDGLAETLKLAGPWAPFWEGMSTTTSFVQNTPAASKAPAVELPPEVLKCIEESQPYYEKLLAVAKKF